MKINIRTAKGIVGQFMSKAMDTNIHSPIMLHSSPGVGKSAVVKQITEEMNIGFIDVRLGAMEAADVQGIPYVGTNAAGDTEMKFSTPEWFPTDPDSKGILFFDEISNANIGVQHAAYRIILDREIQNGEKLPDGWHIVAAGNLKGDKTGAKDIAPALANRFGIHLEIDANREEFVNYALSTGIDSRVIGFLEWKPDALYRFDPKKNEFAFPTPRSWEALSELLGVGFKDNELSTVVSGCVGEATTHEFMSFLKYFSKLPSMADIASGKTKYKVDNKDRGVVFALTSSLIGAAIEYNDDDKKIKNLWKVVDQLDEEFIALVYKSIKVADSRAVINLVKNTMPTWKRVSKRLSDTD